jgi:type VI secretion system secreted protein VgrG
MTFTQDNRLIAIDTPLGKDVLLLSAIQGNEGISTPFSFELDLLSVDNNIKFKDIIGSNVTVSIVLADGTTKRYFNGLISRFAQVSNEAGGDLRLALYSATMVPGLWLLTKTADSKIFQGKTVPDILKEVLGQYDFLDFKLELDGEYEERDYCVQYRETDFNFVSRLMEEEGIFYFFEHGKKKHTPVIADKPDKNKPYPKHEKAWYELTSGGEKEKKDMIEYIEVAQEITAGKYTLNDFNFETPRADLKMDAPSQMSLGPGDREVYDYPGGFGNKDGGKRLANIRMQEEEAEITTISGSGRCKTFTSGYIFTLIDYYRDDMNEKKYVLTSVSHSASQEYSQDSGGYMDYSNSFTCIPYDVIYRPQRVTPLPVVEGPQTAIVVGPSGEEIHTDKHGRVRVQFHWDREGTEDENSSCWIRVSQLWAGAGWGAMYIPRIGQEVIVDFIEGNPDRPIITGRVYHGTNKPPYGLPGAKTQSTIMSNSTKGGGGSNELRFEDKKGGEEVYIHAQKDTTITTENDKNQNTGHDETLSIGNNRTKTVGVDQSETVGSNKAIKVGSNHTEAIGANMSQNVGSSKTETIAIAKALTIGAAYQVSVGAAMNETIGALKAEEIGAAKTVNVGAFSSENVALNKSVDAGKDISESAGKNISQSAGDNFTMSSGKKMSSTAGDDYSVVGKKKGVIDIADQLTIKCGSSSITMKKDGTITIKGKDINVNGSGDIVMKAKKILQN